MDIFTAIYFAVLVIETAIRAPLNKMRRQEKMSERRITNQEKILLGLLLIGGLVAPIIYAATDWLDFADYTRHLRSHSPPHVRVTVAIGDCTAIASSKLDRRFSKSARLHSLLFPASQRRRAIDDRTVRRPISCLHAKSWGGISKNWMSGKDQPDS